MPANVNIVNQQGKSVGEQGLNEKVFSVPTKEHLLFDAVLAHRGGQRQGSAKTKTRGEVRGSTRKPYRQKGTGSARQGSTRSPLLLGGGTVFGPSPRSFAAHLPKKVRREAMKSVLSQKQAEGKIRVFDAFSLKAPKTKTVVDFLKKLKIESALIVDKDNGFLHRSARNIPRVKYTDVEGINVYDVLKYDVTVISAEAVKRLEERLSS